MKTNITHGGVIYMSMTYEQIKDNTTIQTYIAQADKSLAALGFTEHSFAVL